MNTILRDLRNPFQTPPTAAWAALKFFVFVCAAVAAGIALDGCIPSTSSAVKAAEVAAESASYKKKLSACRTENATCLGYVACRKRVAAEHGQSYEGRCEP